LLHTIMFTRKIYVRHGKILNLQFEKMSIPNVLIFFLCFIIKFCHLLINQSRRLSIRNHRRVSLIRGSAIHMAYFQNILRSIFICFLINFFTLQRWSLVFEWLCDNWSERFIILWSECLYFRICLLHCNHFSFTILL